MDIFGEAINENEFKFEIGEDILQEMISGFSYENIFDELIQNDYDAKSPMTIIHFMSDKLVVEGFGVPIDENGWKRLKKILGTGKDTPPKKSKLGIKNIGLKALFLIGDYILIKSAKRRAILSLDRGTNLKVDTTFTKEKGVYIEVPYRTKPYKTFQTFDEEKERKLCNRISETLPHSIIKLPLDEGNHLRKVKIIFDRLGISIDCKVTFNELKSRTNSRKVYQRKVEFVSKKVNQQNDEDFKPIKKIFREIEYIERIKISDAHGENRIPDYFNPRKIKNGISLNIGISIPIESRSRIDKSIPGRLFYPIGLYKRYTGNYFSISAPFNLNDTRDRLNDNDFNEEIIRQAAKTASKLLKIELIPLFGLKAYDVLLECTEKNELFIETLISEIRDKNVLLNNKYTNVTNHLHEGLFLKNERYLPCSSDKSKRVLDLYGFIDDSKLLSSKINHKVTINLLNHEVVKPFTICDIVNLMANDEEVIRTNECIGRHFTKEYEYREELKNVDNQKKYLDAIGNHYKELENKNKDSIKRLKDSKSLLNANGDLSKWDLYIFDGVESNFKGFDKSSIIHPKLKDLRLFKKHKILSKYNISSEITERYIPLFSENSSKKERERFLHFILDNIDSLKGKTIGKLKNIQIFPDENNKLCTFGELYFLDDEVEDAFGKTLHYPAPILLNNSKFMNVFKIKRKITDAEILKRMKDIHPNNQNLRKKDSILFEKFLSKRKMSKNLLNKMKPLFHTFDTNNRLILISITYENKKSIRDIIGSKDVHYVKGSYNTLYRKLGMNTKPMFSELISFLRNMRDHQKPIKHYKEFYIKLVRAIKDEKIEFNKDSDEEIIFVNGSYFIPRKVLVNPSNTVKNDFKDFRVYFTGCSKYQKSALIKLGCKEKPTSDDYKELLEMIAEECEKKSPDEFRKHYRKRIHSLYERRELNEVKFEDNDEIILTDSGAMVSVRYGRENKVVINDNDSISEQLKEKGLSIADFGSLEGRLSQKQLITTP